MTFPKKYFFLFLTAVASLSIVQFEYCSTYQEEFKTFQALPSHKTIFNDDANANLKGIQRDLENYKELSFVQRLILSGVEMAHVTPKTMPKLYGFIDTLCKKHGIKKTPSVFIGTNKGFFNAFALKLLQGTGVIVIGEKLILETTDQELEAIVAHELGHIKYDHVNKKIFIVIGCAIGASVLTNSCTTNPQYRNLVPYLAVQLIPPFIINKRFEKEADEFAYKVTNNGKGLIQFFEHLEQKEKTYDADFDATRALLQKSNNSTLDYAQLIARYYWAKSWHMIGKAHHWVYHNTPFGDHPSHEERIKAVQKYLASHPS